MHTITMIFVLAETVAVFHVCAVMPSLTFIQTRYTKIIIIIHVPEASTELIAETYSKFLLLSNDNSEYTGFTCSLLMKPIFGLVLLILSSYIRGRLT